MFPSPCDYYRAASTREALTLLEQHPDGTILAGGHSLIPMMKLRLARPTTLIDIGRINELKGISKADETLQIGALTTHAQLVASDLLATDCPLLVEAAASIADPQVRNKGTIGGNIAHADPSSDLPAVLIALDAEMVLQSSKGNRRVGACDFFVGLLTCAVQPGELLVRIDVPRAASGTGSAYLKVEHPASGYAVCGAAAIVTMAGEHCTAARLVFNGIATTPLDAVRVADSVVGTSADDSTLAAAVDGNLEVKEPLGDLHASGEYRKHLAEVFGLRALVLARDRASEAAT